MIFKEGIILAAKMVLNGKTIDVAPSDEIVEAMNIADTISQREGSIEMVVTSLIDGKHMKGTKHSPNKKGKINAFDIRTWHYSIEQGNVIIKELRSKLGNDYDVVDERFDKNGKTSKQQHIHIEYDPK